MSIRKAALKGTALVGVGRMFDRGLQFLRNIIVARLLSPEDFGIAALFAMTISLLEMISNLAVDTLLIQSPQGDEPKFQQTSQLMIAVRGLALGLIIFLSAGLVSRLFDVPRAAWAFRLLAAIPVIRGFAHQDITRMQRQMNFKPVLIVGVFSQLVSAALAWPLAAWLGDYSAILYLLIVQTASRTMLSHILAERSYSWTWDPVHARRIVSFGWPLLINGILMFVIFQGDRFVIGAGGTIFGRETYSKALLGLYSVAFLMTTVADEALWSIVSPVLLPMLSRVQDSKEQFLKRYRFGLHLVSIISIPLGIFFISMGGWMLVTLYEEQYSGAGVLVAWLGAAQSSRLIRRAPTLAALALGDSRNPTISNAFRSTSFIACFILAGLGLNIHWIAASGLAGELLALGASVYLLKGRFCIPAAIHIKAFLLPVIGMLLAGIGWLINLDQLHSYARFGYSSLISGGIVILYLLLFRDFWHELRELLQIVMKSRFRSVPGIIP